jgi:hypothetical protein
MYPRLMLPASAGPAVVKQSLALPVNQPPSTMLLTDVGMGYVRALEETRPF